MPDKILRKISQLISDPEFDAEHVGTISLAAKSLCIWVRAIERYGVLYRQLAPKRERLKVAKEDLEKKRVALNEQLAKLQDLRDKVQQLTAQYDEKVVMKERLKGDILGIEEKLKRTQTLITGLAAERVRWSSEIERLDVANKTVLGDTLLAAAFMSYLGTLSPVKRSCIVVERWLPVLTANNVVFNESFDFLSMMLNMNEELKWISRGLLDDRSLKENALILLNAKRFPLVIDPHNQSSDWLNAIIETNTFKYDPKDRTALHKFLDCVSVGRICMIYDFVESLELPILKLAKMNLESATSIQWQDRTIK
jgi:dynein heavy chain